TAGMNFVERLGQARQARFLAAVHVRSGMGHQIAEAESLRANQLDNERLDRAAAQYVIGGSEVDEIGVVRHRQAQARLPPGSSKEPDVLVGQFLGGPLIRTFREQLHGRTLMLLGCQQGMMAAAGNRHVSAEVRHASPDDPRFGKTTNYRTKPDDDKTG